MFNPFKRSRDKEAVHSAAYKLGNQFGSEVSQDIDSLVDDLIIPRRKGFLSALEQRIADIKEMTELTYEEQVRSEFEIMLGFWSERRAEQEAEIVEALTKKWSSDVVELSIDSIKVYIDSRLSTQDVEIIAGGSEIVGFSIGRYERHQGL